MTSPLLVLSQYVYAKKPDGGFYSGRIEGKQSENTYDIAFSDHTRSTVDENDLVWLGFYSLPPHIWPKSPNIHAINSPTNDDAGLPKGEIKQEAIDDIVAQRPQSLRLLKNPKDWARKEQQKLVGKEEYVCSKEHCQCGEEKIASLAESSPTREDRIHMGQVRSSVLRLNRKVLSEEISQKQNERETCSPPSFDTTYGNEWTRYDEMRERYLSSASHGSISPPQSSSYICRDPPYFSPPCLTPPSTPGNQPPPLFICNPYETAVFGEVDAREWKHMDRRDVGGGKRRRRDNMKKCRKVYGIDNRDLWCTQCKWKKACTRFQIGNFAQRHF